MLPLCNETSTAKALEPLRELMVKMQYQSVEEIQSGFQSIMNEIEHELNERYVIAERATARSVHYSQLELMRIVGDTEWWNSGIAEALRLDEEDALEQMSWIAEPENAPCGLAPEDRYLSMISQDRLPGLPPPVGRDSFIKMLADLGQVSLT